MEGLVHTLGMTGSIILFIVLVSFLFLAVSAIKGLCTRKGDTTNVKVDVDKMHLGDNYNFNSAPAYKVWRGTRYSEREWVLYTGNRDAYELAAGYRSTLDPAYITADGYPQAVIFRTSPRVYTNTEEAYAHEYGNGYALLLQAYPGAIITNEIFGDTKGEHDAALCKVAICAFLCYNFCDYRAC